MRKQLYKARYVRYYSILFKINYLIINTVLKTVHLDFQMNSEFSGIFFKTRVTAILTTSTFSKRVFFNLINA